MQKHWKPKVYKAYQNPIQANLITSCQDDKQPFFFARKLTTFFQDWTTCIAITGRDTGVELALTLIDTTEMYAEGESERLVDEAIRGLREQVFLVSKAYPQNASRQRLSLGTDRFDLYLLHWRGRMPLAGTVAAGKIWHWDVSNLDTADLQALVAAGGAACATDQVL